MNEGHMRHIILPMYRSDKPTGVWLRAGLRPFLCVSVCGHTTSTDHTNFNPAILFQVVGLQKSGPLSHCAVVLCASDSLFSTPLPHNDVTLCDVAPWHVQLRTRCRRTKPVQAATVGVSGHWVMCPESKVCVGDIWSGIQVLPSLRL